MALVHHTKREINAKIVYYGPERAGKATSLRYLYDRIRPELRGELKSVPASGSSLLFFDFSPFEQPLFGGYRVRLHIYTLQGRVDNPAAWKMTLKGADGLVIVTDTAARELTAARQSVAQLRDFLGGYGVGLDDVPHVLQLNKTDLAGQQQDGEETALALGLPGCSTCPTTARNGEGILRTLATLSRMVMTRIGERDDLTRGETGGEAAAPAGDAQAAGLTVATPEPALFSPPLSGGPPLAAPESLTPAAVLPRIAVDAGGIQTDGGTIRIPLEVSGAAGVQRLMISVSIGTA